ncbi:hypothetical protein J1N35_012287 [Gossypium stocksii]|uniref:Retrotransposon gag domain-containing protein n=1 Tax=Gossypium stocksii TaxID=47602 RepID=A0A9D3W3M7_9ROSI|nr:hypothetical protein J1N35_012287 [Gossypium stocksii]
MILGSMATTNSADSASVEPSLAPFSGDRVITSFPRHEFVQLAEETYMQWQQQVKLILDGYDLLGLLDGTLPPPARFVQNTDGSLAPNPSAQVFKQQDRFLTSWLLSTISASLLPSFIDAKSACDVWTTAMDLFAANTGAKQSRLRHELHSLKKGNMSVTTYVARIKNLCALLETSGSRISDEEKIEIMLAGLPPEFEAVVSSASLLTGLLSFQRLVNALVECESRQNRAVQELSLHANLVETASSPVVESFVRGGRSSPRGRGRQFRPQIQCQICNRFGHLAQRCYYRYHRDPNPSSSTPPAAHQEGTAAPCGLQSTMAPVYGDERIAPFGRSAGDEWACPQVKTPRVSYYPSAGQNHLHVGQNQACLGQNQDYGVADYCYGQSASGPQPLLENMPRPIINGPLVVGYEFGQFGRDFGQPIGVSYGHRPCDKNDYCSRPNAPILPSRPTTKNVQGDPSWGLGPNAGLMGGVSVPWHTKPLERWLLYTYNNMLL